MKAAEGAGKGRSSRGFWGKQYEQYEQYRQHGQHEQHKQHKQYRQYEQYKQYRQHEQHKQHGGSNSLAGRHGRLPGKQGVCREEIPRVHHNQGNPVEGREWLWDFKVTSRRC
jgi:3-hydroxy-3-methylglutaryl CoA synthase